MKKEVIAWSLYDFANTAFTSPFRTIFWPLLVTSILGGNEFQLGMAVTVATLIFSILVPFTGSISDETNRRMPYIIIPTIMTVIIVAIIPYVGLLWNLILATAAIVLYNIALSIYYSLLPQVASHKETGKISGIGMGAGFLGTIISLLAAYGTLKYFGDSSFGNPLSVKAVFPILALFFFIFSLPLFLTLKDKNIKKKTVHYTKTLSEITKNLKRFTFLKGMVPFLIAAIFFANAIAAIDVFFFLFAKKEIGISLLGFMLLFMAQSLGASFGAVFFGKLADKIGPKKTLTISGIMWIIVVSAFILSKSIMVFWIAGVLGSLAFGSTLAVARTMFVFLAPKKNLGEFFGYSQIIGKFTGLLGPVVSGWLIVHYGYNVALSVMLVLLIGAVASLQKVPSVR